MVKKTRTVTRVIFFSVVISASLSPLFFLSCVYAFRIPGHYRLSVQPGVAIGKVESKLPDQGKEVAYSFIVDSKKYHGEGWLSEFDHIVVGDSVTVHYDPLDPRLSMLEGGDASQFYRSLLIVTGIFSVFLGLLFGIPTGCVVAVAYKRKP
jgi:hypothetical protein